MDKQLKGIAIVLFGILLVIASIPIANVFEWDYDILLCIVGIIVGFVGMLKALCNK